MKKYLTPEWEIMDLDGLDIITGSPNGFDTKIGEDTGNDGFGNNNEF